MANNLNILIKKQNEKALEEFMLTLCSVRRYLEIIESATDDHLGFSPDEINWGHVGNAQSLLSALRSAAEIVDVEKYI